MAAPSGIPAQYRYSRACSKSPENGGLPAFGFNGLATLGSNNFLPSDEISQTLQVTDDFTKIYGKHSFKMGIEVQHVKFSTLQPACSRGQFDYQRPIHRYPWEPKQDHRHCPVPAASCAGYRQLGGENIPASVAFNYSGGSDDIRASNINKTYD